ncbi:alpha/beta hydrolase [Leptospira ognonensis]|uniref:alpha/beta hydrolase n=1 Tax=Leptospira ognonensis TaxID=2484945 RepID=UPI001FE581D2|nr:alpha/beta hydrolase [Leptospira ognonensis]
MNDFELIVNGYLSNQYRDSFIGLPRPRLLLLIWPSTGGNARSFRIKESELISQKIMLIRYNPTSHGNSFGNYNPSDSIDQLMHFLRLNHLLEIPLVGIGHSGGGAALVMLGNQLKFLKKYLLSPILNSRLSLEYLYENRNIDEFLKLIISDSKNNETENSKQREVIYSRLADPSWLYTANLRDLNFTVKNHRIHLADLATFLRNLFIPGFDITEQILNNKSPMEIFLPKEDKWFPRDRTIAIGKQAGIKISEIESAKDHFFTSSWLSVWQKIKSEIFT